MGLIGNLVRVSIPTGFVYCTVIHGWWAPAVGSPEANKVLQSRRKLIDVTFDQANEWRSANIDPLLKPYVDTSKIPNLKIVAPDVVQYWNCGVRTAIKSIADFDASKLFKNIVAMGDKLSGSETSPENKTSS